MNLSIDFIIIITYLVVTLAIGLRVRGKTVGIRDFAVSKRNYSTSIIVATLTATLIGGGTTFGIAEKAYSVGIIYLLVFFGFAFNKLLLSEWIAPRFGSFHGMISVGDMMESFYGKYARIISGGLAVIVSAGYVAAQVGAVGYIFNYFLGIPAIWGITCSFVFFFWRY